MTCIEPEITHNFAYNSLCNSKYDKCGNLGAWCVEVSELHQRWREGTEYVEPEMLMKMNQLSSMGFGFDVFPYKYKERTWEGSFELLLQYQDEHRTTRVPHHYKADARLGSWVHVQRAQYKLFMEGQPSRLTAEKIQRLDDIGFEWVVGRRGKDRNN